MFFLCDIILPGNVFSLNISYFFFVIVLCVVYYWMLRVCGGSGEVVTACGMVVETWCNGGCGGIVGSVTVVVVAGVKRWWL